MKKLLITCCVVLAACGVARSQQPVIPYENGAPGSAPLPQVPYNYAHVTTDTTTDVKTSAGRLHAICLNTIASTEVITLYDSLSATGTVIGVITEASGQSPTCLTYDVNFINGLTVVSATAAGDLTILFK